MKDKLAIFDLDGTLVDTCMANYEAYKLAVEEVYGEWPVSFEKFRDEYYGRNYKDFLWETGITDPNILSEIHGRKSDVYEQILKRHGRANTFLLDVIRGIQDSYNIAIVTTAARKNSQKVIDLFLKDIEIDYVVTAEDVERLKPDTEGIVRAIEHFGIEFGSVVYFDDGDECIEAAKRLGITAYQVCL